MRGARGAQAATATAGGELAERFVSPIRVHRGGGVRRWRYADLAAALAAAALGAQDE